MHYTNRCLPLPLPEESVCEVRLMSLVLFPTGNASKSLRQLPGSPQQQQQPFYGPLIQDNPG